MNRIDYAIYPIIAVSNLNIENKHYVIKWKIVIYFSKK